MYSLAGESAGEETNKTKQTLSRRHGASDGGSPSGRRPSGAIGGGVASPRLVSGWHANSHTSMRIHARRAACVTPASLLSCPHMRPSHTQHTTQNTRRTQPVHLCMRTCHTGDSKACSPHARSATTSRAHAAKRQRRCATQVCNKSSAPAHAQQSRTSSNPRSNHEQKISAHRQTNFREKSHAYRSAQSQLEKVVLQKSTCKNITTNPTTGDANGVA